METKNCLRESLHLAGTTVAVISNKIYLASDISITRQKIKTTKTINLECRLYGSQVLDLPPETERVSEQKVFLFTPSHVLVFDSCAFSVSYDINSTGIDIDVCTMYRYDVHERTETLLY